MNKRNSIILPAAGRFLLAAYGLLLVAACFLLPAPALAQEPDYEDVTRVARQLNCPTCVGINLADCRTQTCRQWRDQIESLLGQGYSDQEVLDYFATQYGTQVLQEPPRSGFTLILWILPTAALLAGGVWLFFTLRAWSKPAAESPLSAPPDAPPSPPAAVSDDYVTQVERDLGLDERSSP